MPNIAFTALLYLFEVTRSLQPDARYSSRYPRAYAPWSVQESQLIEALQNHGFELNRAAVLVQRSIGALKEHKTNSERPISLSDLPTSELPFTENDFDLLRAWDVQAPRDPLGWRYGEPAPPERLANSPVRTLRIIEVDAARPGEASYPANRGSPLGQAYHRHELDDAARSTWIDLAATLVQQPGTQVLLPAPDPHHTVKLAIREAIRRVRNLAAPKLRVSTYPFPSPKSDLQADVVLIDRPDRWADSAISSLEAQTIILVLPHLRLNTGAQSNQPPDPQLAALPVLLQDLNGNDPEGHQLQETLIARWSTGRQVERQLQQGVPNSSGMPARLDWPAIRLLPASGQVISVRVDFLVRAAAWYGLVNPSIQPPTLPTSILENLQWVEECCGEPSLKQRVDLLHERSSSLEYSTFQRVLGRVWLDVLSMSPSEDQAAHEPRTALTFDIVTEGKPDMTYIGR